MLCYFPLLTRNPNIIRAINPQLEFESYKVDALMVRGGLARKAYKLSSHVPEYSQIEDVKSNESIDEHVSSLR